VHFSLSVLSDDAAIPKLASFERHTRLERGSTWAHLYDFGAFSFEEDDWNRRAELLASKVGVLLDRLEGTGFSSEDLVGTEQWALAYFSFTSGAETIPAEIVRRLGELHATIWIDASAES
jgi:hypothetical protein